MDVALTEVEAILTRLEEDDPQFEANARFIFGRPPYEIATDHELLKLLETTVGHLNLGRAHKPDLCDVLVRRGHPGTRWDSVGDFRARRGWPAWFGRVRARGRRSRLPRRARRIGSTLLRLRAMPKPGRQRHHQPS